MMNKQPFWAKRATDSARTPVLGHITVIALTAAILVLLFYHVNVHDIVLLISGVPAGYWLAAAFLTFSLVLLAAWRWKLILESVDFQIGIGECLVIILGVWPLSTLTPAKSGDLLRAVRLRKRIGPTIVIGSILTERFFDLFSLAILALIGSIYIHEPPAVYISGLIVLCFCAVILVVDINFSSSFSAKLSEKLQDLLRTLRHVKKSAALFSAILCLSLAKWLLTFVLMQALFAASGVSIPYLFIAAAMPVAIVIGLLPVTLGGMGIREGAMLYLFADYATATQILAAGLLYTFWGYWLFSLVGLFFTKKALDATILSEAGKSAPLG